MDGKYTQSEVLELEAFFRELARRTRKSGRISRSRIESIHRDWDKYSAAAVIAAIRIYMAADTMPSQNERYVTGIIRNKEKEIIAGKGLRDAAYKQSAKSHFKAEGDSGQEQQGEGERLNRLYRGIASDIECDF